MAAFGASEGLFVALDGGRNRQLTAVGPGWQLRRPSSDRRAAVVFGAGDDIPDVVGAGQQQCQRRSRPKARPAEAGARISGASSRKPNFRALLVRVIPRMSNTVACISLLRDTHRAATHFATADHHVVGVGVSTHRVGLQLGSGPGCSAR